MTRLPTTPDSVSLNARWAPMTSLLRRLTSAPVRVRVKKAMGWRCTWSNTLARRSRISPSPMLAENHRVATPRTASATARRAIRPASPTTTSTEARCTIASTTRPASTGVATASTAPTMLSTRNAPSRRPCGRANATIRRSVSRDSGLRCSSACIAWYSDVHAVISMLIGTVPFAGRPVCRGPPTVSSGLRRFRRLGVEVRSRSSAPRGPEPHHVTGDQRQFGVTAGPFAVQHHDDRPVQRDPDGQCRAAQRRRPHRPPAAAPGQHGDRRGGSGPGLGVVGRAR